MDIEEPAKSGAWGVGLVSVDPWTRLTPPCSEALKLWVGATAVMTTDRRETSVPFLALVCDVVNACICKDIV